MPRGESPIKHGNSWFSTKSILVDYYKINLGVELFLFDGGVAALLRLEKLQILNLF